MRRGFGMRIPFCLTNPKNSPRVRKDSFEEFFRNRRIGTELRSVLFGLFFIGLISSCGNSENQIPETSSNDSIPADIRAINEKINSDRNNADLYFQRAKSNFAYKNFETAIGDMQIALKIDSTKPNYYIFLSDLYFTQNKTKDTRDMLRKAISMDVSNTEALMKYSQLFYLLRKYDTATFYINRSLHYDRANAIAHFQKGMILKEAGDTATAISCFQSAVELNQKYYEAYMQLGMLLSAKRSPLALGYFNNALDIDSKSIEAYYAKGIFLQSVGDYESAMKEYNTILSISPEHQDATFNIGTILFEQKKYDEAIKKFELTIKRDENFFRGYYGRGRTFEALNQKQKAIDDYKHCLAIQPDYKLAALQLEIISQKM